jgi:transposase-like protein
MNRPRPNPRPNLANDVEIFFSERNLVFVVNAPSTATLAIAGGIDARRYLEQILGFNDRQAVGVLIGGVGAEQSSIKSLVDDFCASFEFALRKSIDGRKARHLKFQWEARNRRRSGDEQILARLRDEEVGLRFSGPVELDESTIGRVAVMTDSTSRLIIREIGESGFVRHEDLLGRRGKRREEFTKALDKIKESGLVSSEYLLQCRKTSAQLVRVQDIEELSIPSAAGFRCASCNRPFVDELISEGYALSSEGRALMRGSHWMTVWVTEQLLAMGVLRESIFWNLEESGEEVDIVIDHVDRVWIFELKDREFGAGDAYPFNYRKVRYKADEAVVITTERVAPDAIRVFADLAGTRKPVLIEGLDNVTTTLSERFEAAGSTAARNALMIPSAVSGFDLRAWRQQVG